MPPILFRLQDTRRCGSVSPLDPARLNGAQANQVPRLVGTTWNPSDKYVNIALSQSNTVGLGLSGVGSPQIARATASKTSAYQDFYFECDAGNSFNNGADIIIGLDDGTSTLSSFPTPGRLDSKGISYRSDGVVFFNNNSAGPPSIAPYARGQRVGVYVSPSRGKVWFAVNNKWDGDPVAGTGGFSPGLTTYFPFAGVNWDEFFFGYWDVGSLLYAVPASGVAFDSAAITASVGVAAGIAADAFIGAAQDTGTGASTGVASDAVLGAANAASAGSAVGTATDAAIGNANATAIGSSDGASTVSGVATDNGNVGTSAGMAAVSGVGAALDTGVGASVGTAADAVIGAVQAVGVGTSAGLASDVVVGRSQSAGVGASACAAATAMAGAAQALAAASTAASATVAGIPASAGVAAGSSAVSGIGRAIITGVGLSQGAAVINAPAFALCVAIAAADGSAIIIGVGDLIDEEHLQYPLADVPQHRPNESAVESYPIAAQTRPLTAEQTYPRPPQHYPLEDAA